MTPIQKDQQLQPRTPLIISYLPINLPRNRSFFNNTCSPIRSTIAFTWTTITVITNCWHTSKIRTSTPDDAASFNKIASREIWGFSISPCSFSCLVRPTVKLPLLLCYFTSFSLNFQIMTRFLLIWDRFGIIFEKFNASVILSAKYFVPVFFSVITLHTRTSSRKIKMRNLFVPNLIPKSKLGDKIFCERREPLLSLLSAQNLDK